MVKNTEKNVENTSVKPGFISGTGRRKTAVARVFLYEGKGEFLINDMSVEEYFGTEEASLKWMKPFIVIGVTNPKSQFNASIKVEGSGKPSQLDAIVLGLSRALAKMSEENKVNLSRNDLLTRDPRMVERKKPYLRKARKAPQYSKR